MKPGKTLLTALALAVPMTFPTAGIAIAAGDACAARNDDYVNRGTAYCMAGETSRVVAVGPLTFATAATSSVARVTSRDDSRQDSADARKFSTAIVRNGGTASAYEYSIATATNGLGIRSPAFFAERTIANAEGGNADNGAEASADGPGSKAYAKGPGSVAIATNGGCAEAFDGAIAIADGPGEPVVRPKGRAADDCAS